MVRCNFTEILPDPDRLSRFDIDWLSFTVRFNETDLNNLKFIKSDSSEIPFDIFQEISQPYIDQILFILGLDQSDFFLQAGGMQRYSEFYDFKGSASLIYLTCHNRPDMGIYFSLSSSFIHWIGEDKLFLLMAYIKAHDNIKPSRVDILFDDFDNKSFDYRDFQEAAYNYSLGLPTWLDTHCSTLELYSEGVSNVYYNNRRVDFRDMNICLGRRTSNTYCRIYNKMIEQISKDRKHYDGTDPTQLPIYFWKRIELELKHDHAVEFFNNFSTLKEIPNLFCIYLERLFRILDKESADNKPAEWWSSFVNAAHNIYFVQLPKEELPCSYHKAREQMLKQYGSLLSVMLERDYSLFWLRSNIPKIDNNTTARYKKSIESG